MINPILLRNSLNNERLKVCSRSKRQYRVPLPVLKNLFADRRAYRQLLAEHQKALAVLAIHAADDAGAGEILETSTARGGKS